VALALLVVVPLARADGDPASDWLLQRLLFTPPDTAISSGDAARLSALLQSARRQGYTLHVAVVPTRYDMGAVTVLFNRPHDYAPFLSQELYFLYRGRVLVVMPKGFAIARNGKPDLQEQRVLDRLAAPGAARGSDLAAATETAVRALARNAGITVSAPAVHAGGGSSTARDRVVIGVVAALLAAAGLTWAVWRRRGRPRRRPAP
jgi:hypothetical protein